MFNRLTALASGRGDADADGSSSEGDGSSDGGGGSSRAALLGTIHALEERNERFEQVPRH